MRIIIELLLDISYFWMLFQNLPFKHEGQTAFTKPSFWKEYPFTKIFNHNWELKWLCLSNVNGHIVVRCFLNDLNDLLMVVLWQEEGLKDLLIYLRLIFVELLMRIKIWSHKRPEICFPFKGSINHSMMIHNQFVIAM